MRDALAAAIVLARVPQGGVAATRADPPGSDRNINPTRAPRTPKTPPPPSPGRFTALVQVQQFERLGPGHQRWP